MISLDTITDTTVQQFSFENPRSVELVHGLIRHLHAYAKDVGLTHSEWRTGLEFLTAAGAITDHKRNEFGLISDVLGFSSLVDLIASPKGATPGSVLGPFHVHDSIERPNGYNLKGDQAGTATLFDCRVLNSAGEPVQAHIDFWQNADNALYPQMDAAQDYQNLRCKLTTDPDGRFNLKTVLPKPYGIPEDGPVGDLMRAAKRHCMRPAHFHVIVTAPGYRDITTEVFLQDDPYLESDAVFGVRPSLITPFVEVTDPAVAKAAGMPSPFTHVVFEFRMVPAMA